MPTHYVLWSISVAVFALYAFVFQKYLRIVINLFLGVSIRTIPDEDGSLEGQTVHFRSTDGIPLAGLLLRTTSATPTGVVVFSHEFGSDKWSAHKYCDFLREAGFHVFALDYRGHGESGNLPDYEPRHWVTDREVSDLKAALSFLGRRSELAGLPFGVFGISRGGTASILAAADDHRVSVVICDGAFATRTTLIHYMRKWVSIFTDFRVVYKNLPGIIYRALADLALRVSALRIGTRFPSVEKALQGISVPLLFIHGEKDTYISARHAPELAALARGPADVWVVPGARHNECRTVAAVEYEERVAGFFKHHMNRVRETFSPSGIPQ